MSGDHSRRTVWHRWGLPSFALLALLPAAPGSCLVVCNLLVLLHPRSRRRWFRRDPWGLWLSWPWLLIAVDSLIGDPHGLRFAIAGLGGVVAMLSLVGAFGRKRRRPRTSPPVAFAVIALLLAGGSILATIPAERGADLFTGQDTAYFTRIVHEAGQGRPPRDDLVGSVLYDPPLEHHFGAHLSPVVYVLGPVLRWLPDWRTLAVIRSLVMLSFLAVFAVGLRRRISPPTPLWWLLPLTVPALWFQPLHSVYLLPLAAPFAAASFLGAASGRMLWLGVGLAGAALVREDAVLFVGIGSLLITWGRGRHRGIGALAALASVVWYVVATRWIMPAFSATSGQAIAVLFEDVGGPGGFLRHPGILAQRILGQDALRSMWIPLRSTGLLALLSPFSLAAIPAHGVNLVAGGKGFGTLMPTSHYGVLPAVAIGMGALCALSRHRTRSGRWSFMGSTVPLSVILTLWITGGILSAADALVPRGIPATLQARPQQQFSEALRQLPLETSVAAPACWLPHLALHRETFMIERFSQYPRSPQPDAVVLAPDAASLRLAPARARDYEQTMHDFLMSTDYEIVLDVEGWRILRRRTRIDEDPDR